MDKTILASIAAFGAVWAVVQFWLKYHLDQQKARRESGAKFLAEVSQCLAKVRYGTSCSLDCVSFDSYSNFIVNLSFEDAKLLMVCWENYVEARSRENIDNEEIQETLECVLFWIIEHTEPMSLSSVLDYVKHFGHTIFGSNSGCKYCN